MTIKLSFRQYIGVPSGEPRGLVTEVWELPVARTAFVELHCWNIGVPGGIPVPDEYWVFMGSKQNHERMAQIVQTVIAPCMDAARRTGMPIIHVQPESIADLYPNLRPSRSKTKNPNPKSQTTSWESQTINHQPSTINHQPLTINHAIMRAERVHGKGYMNWEGWNRLDVAPQLKPQDGDVVVATTEEFHEWLQDRHITTLIYTGFCANLCIIDSPAAMKAMSRLGYRCVLLREGTMAIEFSDQPPNLHTDAALRYIEAWVGYTASADEFIKALKLVGM